jgi:hypothetical protein
MIRIAALACTSTPKPLTVTKLKDLAMTAWTVQLLTLLGVAIGALASFVSTRSLDQRRWQREQAFHWDTKRLESYSEFATTIMRFSNIANRLAAARGLPTNVQPLSIETGLSDLANAERDLSLQWEWILMLGSPDVILAAGTWRNEARHLEWFARGLRDDPAEFTKAMQDRREARLHFYSTVRAHLGADSSEIPADIEIADVRWTQSTDRPSE